MSFDALRWAFTCEVASSAERLVLLALANDCRNPEMKAFPSRHRLHQLTRLDPKTITAALRKLVTARHIERTGEQKGRTGRIPVYKVRVGNGVTNRASTNRAGNGCIELGKDGVIRTPAMTPGFRDSSTEIAQPNEAKNGVRNQETEPNKNRPAKRTMKGESPYTPPAAADIEFPQGTTERQREYYLAIATEHRLSRDQLQLLVDEIAGRPTHRGPVGNPLSLARAIARQIQIGTFYGTHADQYARAQRGGGRPLSAEEVEFGRKLKAT